MSELDNHFRPFGEYPGYLLMAPCMRDCDHYLEFNGCDNSGCWCKKSNLDRRVSSLEQCASTSCTFADMNTATDVAILSSIQLQYCVDRDLSPNGMTMPSTALAQATDSSSSQSPSETGSSPTEGLGSVVTSSGTGSATRTRPSSGPANTGATASSSTDSTSTPTSSPSASNSGLSTAAKAGIAIGAIFCVLLAILIAILLLRRRKRNPSPHYPPEYTHAAPQMTPSPYAAPAQPVPLHVQTTGHAGSKADVSPIEEKTPAFTHTVSRKKVRSPPMQVASPVPTEVVGSVPPPRHEVHSDAAPGGHADGGQGGGRWVYEMQGQGQGRDGAYELGGGR